MPCDTDRGRSRNNASARGSLTIVTTRVLTTALLIALAGCSGGDACAAAADCPFLLRYEGRDYSLSCASVPRRLVGERLEVSSSDERDYGDQYRVDGYAIEGVDPDTAFVVKSAQKLCGRGGRYTAIAQDLSRAERTHLDRLLGPGG